MLCVWKFFSNLRSDCHDINHCYTAEARSTHQADPRALKKHLLCQHPSDHQKAREFQKNIYFCFIDCTKVFDCVDHNKLWKIL